jgi:hypothetical protein
MMTRRGHGGIAAIASLQAASGILPAVLASSAGERR